VAHEPIPPSQRASGARELGPIELQPIESAPAAAPAPASVAPASAGGGRTVDAGVLKRDLLILLGATVAVAALCSLVGQAELSGPIWRMRLMRLATAATVGAGLSVAGLALQGLLRNPLAEPYVLGIASGAGVGVLVGEALAGSALVGGWALAGWATTPVFALAGALATCGAVYLIAQRRGRLDPYVLLLSGVIINVFNGALMLAILLVVDPNDVISFVGWGMGQIRDTTSPVLLAVCAGAVAAGWAVIFLRGAWFNALSLGDDVAGSSGVSVGLLRVVTFFVAALMTAGAVALAGPVGFVGLIVPHLCRLVIGPDHRRLALVSGLAGAMFLMLADTLCRKAGDWIGVGLVPVGVVTALVGGPTFIFLLRRRSVGGMP
jgi:iron complex transport system permease protein